MASNHLDNLTIHKFRGLHDLELKDLGQINLLVGINNCGKTSVLEAINIYCHPLDIREWLIIARQREREAFRPSLSSIEALQWLFLNESSLDDESVRKGNILIQGSGEFVVKKMKVSFEEIEGVWVTGSNSKQTSLMDSEDTLIGNEDTTDEESYGLRRGIELDIGLDVNQPSLSDEIPFSGTKIQLWEDEFLFGRLSGSTKYNLSTSTVTLSSHRSDLGQLRLFSEARFENLKTDVLALLKQVDPKVVDIEILQTKGRRSLNFGLYIQHEKLGLSPVSTFGDGIRRLLHIALKIARARDGVLLIDEIESAIHTEALQEAFSWIVKWTREFNVQVFATTHSLEAVDALIDAANSASDLVLYRLEPTEAKTRVVRHDWERLKRLRENLGQEVRW